MTKGKIVNLYSVTDWNYHKEKIFKFLYDVKRGVLLEHMF